MTKPVWEPTEFTKQVRTAVAEYMHSEGCGCCSNREKHDADRATLAKLLRIRKKDNWYDFSKYRTAKSERGDL